MHQHVVNVLKIAKSVKIIYIAKLVMKITIQEIFFVNIVIYTFKIVKFASPNLYNSRIHRLGVLCVMMVSGTKVKLIEVSKCASHAQKILNFVKKTI